MNKTSRSSNLPSQNSKTLGSPSFKENTQTISSRYISLLKSKKHPDLKQNVCQTTLQTLNPNINSISFNKQLNRTINNSRKNLSFTKPESSDPRNKSSWVSKSPEREALFRPRGQLAELHFLQCTEEGTLFNVPMKTSELGFRSPPVAKNNPSANHFQSGSPLSFIVEPQKLQKFY